MSQPTYRGQAEWRYPFVCTSCRLVRSLPYQPKTTAPEYRHRCLNCNRELWCAGNAFKTPRRSKDSEWKKLKTLIANGFGGFWRNHGEHRTGPLLKTKGDVRRHLQSKIRR